MKTLKGFKAFFKGNRNNTEVVRIINAENKKEATKIAKNQNLKLYTFDRLEEVAGVIFVKVA